MAIIVCRVNFNIFQYYMNMQQEHLALQAENVGLHLHISLAFESDGSAAF